MFQKDTNGKLVLSDEQIDKAVQKIINKKKKHKTFTFTMLINDKEVTVVKFRNLVDLDKLSPSSRRKVTKRYMLKAFEGLTVKTIDGRSITVKSTGGADKMNFQSKQRISLFIDDLIRTGSLRSIPFIIVMEPGKECGHIGILTGIAVYISESHIVVQLFVRSFKFSDVKVF